MPRKSYRVKALMKLLFPGLRRHHWQHHGRHCRWHRNGLKGETSWKFLVSSPCQNGESIQSHMSPFQGIEALEYYIDPSAEAQVEETAKKPEEPGSSTDGSTPTVIPGQPVAPVSPDQPAVFCQKGDLSYFFYFSIYVRSNILHRKMLSVRPKQSERCEP